MAVYVDSAFIKHGRMIMCHMMADTREELLAMADAIGLDRKWIQNEGTCKEHFDVCKAYRNRALELGAIEVGSRFLVRLRRKKVSERLMNGVGRGSKNEMMEV